MPSTPTCSSAAFTSSSVNGLMIAVTSFMGSAFLARLGGASRGDTRDPRDTRCRAGERVRRPVDRRRAAADPGELVRALRVLALVDAGDLGLPEDPPAHGELDDQAEDQRAEEGVPEDRAGGDRLLAELAQPAAVEEAVRAG